LLVQIKKRDFCFWQGANRSDTGWYREDWQPRQGRKDAFLCASKRETPHQEAVERGNRRLQIGRSGPFLASPLFENTVLLPHSQAMGLQRRQKLSSPGPIFGDTFGFRHRRSKPDSLQELTLAQRFFFRAAASDTRMSTCMQVQARRRKV
jgi:hypothetical protein